MGLLQSSNVAGAVSPNGSHHQRQSAPPAAGLTYVYLDLAGGLRQFVNIVFKVYPAGLGFDVGAIAAPEVVGNIRAGQDYAVKVAMLETIWQ